MFEDELRTPVLVDDADRVSRYALGLAVAEAYGFEPGRIDPVRRGDWKLIPSRPRDLSLDTARLRSVVRHPPRPLREALALPAKQR